MKISNRERRLRYDAFLLCCNKIDNYHQMKMEIIQ